VSSINIKEDIKVELGKFCESKGFEEEWYTNAILKSSMYGLEIIDGERIQNMLGR